VRANKLANVITLIFAMAEIVGFLALAADRAGLLPIGQHNKNTYSD
jgi:hypothetical protein